MKLIGHLALFLFIGCSCSGEKPNYNKLDILGMMMEGDPDLEIMVPPSISQPLVRCSEYLPPCQIGYKVKIKNLEVTALYYEDQKNAFKSAKSMRGYHLRNWAFDQVVGEPILERFFKKHLNATRIE